MNISPEFAERIASWLRRVQPFGPSEGDTIAMAVHALEANAKAEKRMRDADR